ncbi:hypothetical protein F5Y16DRAFT_362073 [Xylariaceae sp. FL0255]|nr:hypothetical protein F5Y16DRAFT_362073 [Xylariaceae sp. FL0255]
MMASKTTQIPRFLLPQYSPMWRTAVRSPAFSRPLNADVGVRYASKKTLAAKVLKNTAPTSKTGLKAQLKARSEPEKFSAAPDVPPPASKPAGKPVASKPTAATKPVTSKTTTTKTATSAATATATPAKEPIVKSAQPSAPAPVPEAPKAASSPAVPDPSKPIVLEKPERFNPPSHGSRLPRSRPKNYGGATTADEIKAQSQRSYPGLPPPNNSWAHWFINSRGIHLFITLGTLTSLAAFTFMRNFRQNSPYSDLIPPLSDLPFHPFAYTRAVAEVVQLSVQRESDETAIKRDRMVEDVAKRNAYRKAHGMEPATGFWGRTPDTTSAIAAAGDAAAAGVSSNNAAAAVDVAQQKIVEEELQAVAESTTEDGKRKKFMGIF